MPIMECTPGRVLVYKTARMGTMNIKSGDTEDRQVPYNTVGTLDAL